MDHSLNVPMEQSSHIEPGRGFRLVALGGGTGLSMLLGGLKKLVGPSDRGGGWLDTLAAIVAVSDDGGSSGRLRDQLQMLPPGDIRNCMVALSEDSTLLSRLFQYRFRGSGDIGGHSFGNLFLAALTEVTGDFVEAVRLSSEVLASKGRIYPATISDVHLVAELEDGSVVQGETQISAARVPIRRMRLEPEHCLPLPEALTAIGAADVITVGPGSLFTSLLPPLMVTSVAEAIGESRATKILICNLMTQPGETTGYDILRHLETIKQYAPAIEFSFVVMNNRPITARQTELYAADGAVQIGVGEAALDSAFGPETQIVRADLLEDGEMVRHHADKVARIVLDCAMKANHPNGAAVPAN
jgi:uncharacterized cofD-like protein